MSPDEQLELLRQFAPTLRFDALERWRPGLVEDYLRHSTVRDGDDRRLPETPPAEGAMRDHGDDGRARLNPLSSESNRNLADSVSSRRGAALWQWGGRLGDGLRDRGRDRWASSAARRLRLGRLLGGSPGRRQARPRHALAPRRQHAEPIELAHEGRLEWRAAGYNVLRQRGEPILPPRQ